MRIIKKILPKSITIKGAILSGIIGGLFLIISVFVEHNLQNEPNVKTNNLQKEPIAKTNNLQNEPNVKKNSIQNESVVQSSNKIKTDANTSSNTNIPRWFFSPPTDTIKYYAVASETSSDLQMAVSKAQMSALDELSKIILSEISSKGKFIKMEGENNQNYSEYSSETTTISNNILVGSQIEKKELVKEDKYWRCYILVSINKKNMLVK